MSKMFLVLLLYFEPTWSYIKIDLSNRDIFYTRPSRNESLEKVSYFEGELIYGSCLVYSDGSGTHFRFKKGDKLIYESIVTNNIFSIIERNVIMQIKMLPEYNNSVLECTDGQETLSVLILLDESIPDYALKINGILFFKLPNNLRDYIYFMNSDNEAVSISVRIEHKINEDAKNQEDSKQILADDDVTVEISSEYRRRNTSKHIWLTEKTHVNTRLTGIEIVCGTLCFDPYFFYLDPSKVLAKYIPAKNNLSVIKYELDFGEESFTIGCTSASGKGIMSVDKGKQMLSHDETTAYINVNASGRYRCCSSEDGRVSTTILDVTRKNEKLTTARKHPGRIQDKTTTSTAKDLTLSKSLCNSLDQNTYGLSEILIAIFVTMISTSVVTIIIYTVCLKHRRRSNKPLVDETNPAPANSAPFYETVGYVTSNEPGEVDRRQREPYPLPSEECEEDKKYLHYDTPYEWRIFRSPFRRVQRTRNVRFSETQN